MGNVLRRTTIALTAAVATAAGLVAITQGSASAQQAAAVPGSVNRLIVGYKSATQEAASDSAAARHVSAKAADRKRYAATSRRLATGAMLVDLGGSADASAVDQMKQAFAADPDVAYVEQDTLVTPLAAPNDTEYAKQWDLFEPTGGMNVPDAWASTTGSGVTVAVIDTGYVAHSDVAANIVPGYDFISDAAMARDGGGRDNNPADEGDWYDANECGAGVPAAKSSWHGTHVAGTIAGVTDNAKGIAGIAYNAKIQPVRVLGKCGGYTSDIVDAITWASGGTVSGVPANPTPAKVINMSLGGSGSCTSTYQNAITAAANRGTTVVVAAGNSNSNVSGFVPASCNNVIAVAAGSREGARAFYSNYGTLVDITAPGGETRRATDPAGTKTTPENGILSTVNAGATTAAAESYDPYMGTSMAAPHIAGLAALMLGKKSLTPAQVESTIKANARPLPGACSGGCGAGLADAAKTIAALDGSTPPPPPPPPATVTVTITNPGFVWGFKGFAASPLQLQATASDGKPVTFSATGLPPGVSITAGGLISGTPGASGTFSVTAKATGTGGASASATFTWWIWGW